MRTGKLEATHFAQDIRDFLTLLNRHHVDYLVVGGEAVIFHGYPRVTGDIDVWYRLTEGNVAALFDALLEFWDGNIPGIQSAAVLAQAGTIVQFGVPPHRIDLINAIDGVAFAAAWPQRVKVTVEHASGKLILPYIGLDALIRNKQASGRPKDLDDLRYLSRARAKRKRAPKRRTRL